uniref:Cytoplasmic tRNA 2-thiolation protein 2 n=1 Tax=Lygus hesperus TaxID=30085 RepID=A0A146LLP1_LYGHE
MPRIVANSSCSICRKCNESPANVVLQNKFPYCRSCFTTMVSHKYRSTLGKSKLMKHGDRVLVAYSGSGSSVCLLNMIKVAMEDVSKKKKIKTETIVLFIDDMMPSIVDDNHRSRIISEIHDSLHPYEFDKYYTTLDSIFDDSPSIVPLGSHTDSGVNSRVQNLIAKTSTATSVNDLLGKLRYNLLYISAKKLNCNKLFLAETSDHLAVSIISNVALGRGAQLPFDVGFRDNRFGDVDILRPLQECSKKEVTFYNEFSALRPVTIPGVSTKASKFDNIQKLTEDFITNLGISFPSTVHTIVATGSKLVVNQSKTQSICGLCKGFVDSVDAGTLSSLNATKLSGLVSSLGPNKFDCSTLSPSNVSRCAEGGCSEGVCSSKISSKSSNVLPTLCYGCQLIGKEFDDLDLWPPPIRKAVEEESCFSGMREEIKDFLL